MKFGRTYKLMIYSDLDSPIPDLTIQYPLTIKFQISNNFTSRSNTARFQIFNLGEKTRETIYRDIFDIGDNYRGLVFAAGYESEASMPIVFRGDILWAYSYRQGPDWITEIEAYDSYRAIQKSQINLTVPSGYSMGNLISQIVGAMEGVEVGQIGTFPAQSSRARTISGNAWDQLTALMKSYNTQPFINKGVVHVVDQDEYIENAGDIREISSDTGLIGTPRRQDAMLKATMMFEPRLEVGQVLKINSKEPSVRLALGMRSDSKVVDISHTGTISGAVSGDALTTATFLVAA